MRTPWTEEPTVWKSFCENRIQDDLICRRLYRDAKEIRNEYFWFSRGFHYGGCR